MKIIFLNVPGHGHVNPTLAVTAELIRRGHQIIYYNTADFATKIAQTGAEFRPYPNPQPDTEELNRRASNLVNVTTWLLEQSQRLLPWLLAELKREQPDLVIFDSICLWGMQAASLLKLPAVSSISTFVQEGVRGMMTFWDGVAIVRQAVPKLPELFQRRRQLTRQFGPDIFPYSHIFPCISDTNIVYTSREFQPETDFVDDTFHFVGPSINTESRETAVFPWQLLAKDNRPLIYISLGTVYHNKNEFYKMAFQQFGTYPIQFILSAGRTTDIDALGPIPDNFIVQNFVPQLELLPRIDAFITHGGMNSVNEGLYFGVPLIVIPQQMEQTLNGRQAARHGAAIVLGDRPPYGRTTPKALHNALQTVLTTPSYRQNAERIGNSFKKSGGYQAAADVITAVLAHPTPQT
ncbi:macrolide family glycosyltransferase [Candidatus Leptofilum sp.]|uniref:macrolide family glycosyltransferase n=1 Tax=Candidatus Leptofilum sp. TaxID=3241576 RepID=UPI003B5AAFA3